MRLSGVTMPPGNKCDVPGCSNNACTSLWTDDRKGRGEGRVQFNICGWHLKERHETEITELRRKNAQEDGVFTHCDCPAGKDPKNTA